MARHRSVPHVLKERNCSKEGGIPLYAELVRYVKYLLQWLTNVADIAISGILSNRKASSLSQSHIRSWSVKTPESRKSVAKDMENKVKHPISRAILKPKMMSPPWLCACWLILRRNQFERVSSLTATNASSVASCHRLSKEHEMTCAISKIPDAKATIEGMSKVSFHLCRYSSYSNIRNWLLKMNIQIPRFHRYKC